MTYPCAEVRCSLETAFVHDQRASKHDIRGMRRNLRQMAGERIVGMEALLWGGIRVPLPLPRPGLTVNRKNAQKVGGATSDDFPCGTLDIATSGYGSFVKRIWKWIVKGSQENLK